MLYHNVMWKFCDAEGKTLDENIEIVRAGLTALPEKFPKSKVSPSLKTKWCATVILTQCLQLSPKTRTTSTPIKFIRSIKRWLSMLKKSLRAERLSIIINNP